MSLVSFDQLLEAGAHFGHMPRKWNPAMAPYIFMERNGIHIIDLHKTVAKIDECAEIIKNMASLSLIHISEPTRHLRISYAVFCLKKKKQTKKKIFFFFFFFF